MRTQMGDARSFPVWTTQRAARRGSNFCVKLLVVEDGMLNYWIVLPVAPVAQLDRASGYEPEGRMFESCRAHQQLSIY